jgi:hypothetical protein
MLGFFRFESIVSVHPIQRADPIRNPKLVATPRGFLELHLLALIPLQPTQIVWAIDSSADGFVGCCESIRLAWGCNDVEAEISRNDSHGGEP